jgi:hypothetical protein
MQRYLGRLGEDIRVFFHDLIYLLLLCGEISRRDPVCGYDISLILRENHEEDKLPHLRDDLLHFLAYIKEITLGGTALGMLYNFLFKVIITLRGLDSYTT